MQSGTRKTPGFRQHLVRRGSKLFKPIGLALRLGCAWALARRRLACEKGSLWELNNACISAERVCPIPVLCRL